MTGLEISRENKLKIIKRFQETGSKEMYLDDIYHEISMAIYGTACKYTMTKWYITPEQFKVVKDIAEVMYKNGCLSQRVFTSRRGRKVQLIKATDKMLNYKGDC